MSPNARNLLKLLFGILLTTLLLRQLDVGAVVTALTRYHWTHVLLALAMFILSWPVVALRWQVFVPHARTGTLLKLTLIGQFYAFVLPGQIAGELVKAWRLSKGSADAERLAASVLVDRVVGIIALLLLAALGILTSAAQVPLGLRVAVTILLACLLVALFALRVRVAYSAAHAVARYVERGRWPRLGGMLHLGVDAWRGFSDSPLRLVWSLVLGIVFQCLAIAIYATLGASVGINVGLADWAWIVGVASVAVLLPLSIAGLGLREGALVGCLAWLGVAGESAIALSLGVFAIMLFGAAIGGLLEAMHALKHKGDPR